MEAAAGEEQRCPGLVTLCVRAVSAHMEALEPEVWELPAVILQDILPSINIYYLDRIEPVAVKKGISTQSIWRTLCKDVVKMKPPTYEVHLHEPWAPLATELIHLLPARQNPFGALPMTTITCWRKKFLEVFFHHVLRGILDVSSNKRINDQRFSPLIYSSKHVTELTICNKLQGVSELTPLVVESLVTSVRTLKFLHLRSPDLPLQQSLQSLLHRLIHHGEVNKVALLSWPAPNTNLLVLILSISAGLWHKHPRSFCRFCSEEARAEQDRLLLEKSPIPDSQVLCGGSVEQHAGDDLVDQRAIECEMGQEETQSALLTLQPLDLNQRPWEEPPKTSHKSHSVVTVTPKHRGSRATIPKNAPRPDSGTKILPVASDQCKGPLPTSQKRLQADLAKKSNSGTQQTASRGVASTTVETDDLYDFIFSVANEKTKTSNGNKGLLGQKGAAHALSAPMGLQGFLGERCLGIPSPDATRRFRSISALNLHNVPLTFEYCPILCNLLSTWVTLEKLTMAYNDLGTNIFPVLEALSALSRCRGCCLHTVSFSDFGVYLPILELAHTIMDAFPSLRVLSLSFDIENYPERRRSEGSTIDFPESQLEQLDIRFPREPLRTDDLLSLLKASRNLCEFSLDNATFSTFAELRCILKTLAEFNTTLRKLTFHDMNFADCQEEVLLLLQKSHLEDLKFSFCHLFERRTKEFLSEFIDALKRNSTIKTLKLCGNRLGNDGLILLADIYSEDSLSSIHDLDVGSSCIKPSGLLQFAKKLEDIQKTGVPLRLTHLSIKQNLMDRDPAISREALQRLQGMCTVISDNWDSNLAFVEHVSIM